MLNKPEKTRIFTFAPRDFWAVVEETEVLHMYIIAKLLKMKRMQAKSEKMLAYHDFLLKDNSMTKLSTL